MVHKVLFSFDCDRDIQRARFVRECCAIQDEREVTGVWDVALWAEAKREGDEAVRRLINQQLENTSVTAVLIGRSTADRGWIQYELERSYEQGNHLLGVTIHNIPDQNGKFEAAGRNPLNEAYGEDEDGMLIRLSALFPTYDWVLHDGQNNFASWVSGKLP